ncbi:MAG: rod shape-determining protein MreC [Candidatus Stahlbacteria bacterium]|nr:rod shape-determining protein MreC [Candidatus Stahlbacteria bacterium]
MDKVGRIMFGVLVGVSILLIGIGNSGIGELIQVRGATIFSPFSGWSGFLFNNLVVRKENKVLKLKLTELSIQNQKLHSLQIENDRLSRLLEFKNAASYKLIPARIVGREANPLAGIGIINKGSAEGVKDGMPVITADGIYGKVVALTGGGAKVETIFNFNFRVAAMDLRTEVQGIVKFDKGQIIFQVPVKSDIEVGDEIVTSEIGSIFPEGIRIGKVGRIEQDETKLFYNVTLEPFCKFYKTKEVFIIYENKSIEEIPVADTPGWKINLSDKRSDVIIKRQDKTEEVQLEVKHPQEVEPLQNPNDGSRISEDREQVEVEPQTENIPNDTNELNNTNTINK